jgi:TPP-dependent pyruvate/acetoin dehydrogenase alpha subunit
MNKKVMKPDLWSLYRQMFRSRLFEEAVIQLWEEGLISGEMHLGIGEEAIVAGIVDQMREGDAMALDYRGTPPLLMREIDPVLLLKEFLGRQDGLCSGMGGHMHLFSPHHIAASSGIVGASGPIAVGFALAAVRLRPRTIAVAFFGEGAVNQGMMMESMNLAVAWQLPVLFVCKNNEWAVTTFSPSVTGGNLVDRAFGFGMHAIEVDGGNVEAVWEGSSKAIGRARDGLGPTFLLAHCTHPEGNFLGDPLLRLSRHPVKEFSKRAGPLFRSVISRKGASIRERAEGLRVTMSTVKKFGEQISGRVDPLYQTRGVLKSDMERLQELEEDVMQEIVNAVELALNTD